ncbi:hypothetical protein OT109_01540 [Phycisphaeraceae bacterium D3-23]
MPHRLTCLILLFACFLLTACATTDGSDRGSGDTAYGVGGHPQLFDGLGDHTRLVTTDSQLAQRYFDQGLLWAYGFNHDEAVRCFTRAAQLDPSCAMAWWGIAYAQGPSYNDGHMNAARTSAAWEAMQEALAQLDNETPEEYALVRALTVRYRDPAGEDNGAGTRNAAYAQRMSAIWADHQGDADIATLYAEALMLKHPWALHHRDGSPARDETNTIIATLEEALALDPRHPGANHYYIHAVEASADKHRALPVADRLSTLTPMAGHLTHMPSHIYVQIGLWDRAVEQNLMATRTDARYLARSPGHYRQHGYIAHNGHMLAFAGMMIGREQDALAGARAVWHIPDALLETMGVRYDRAMCSVYEVLRRFGRWDELLAEPAPPTYLKQTTAVWRACRATAYAAKKDFENAALEHAAFRELLVASPNNNLLKLNDLFISGEIALQQGDWDTAIQHLEQAAAIEDTMGYGEPPQWLQPVRHTLGAVYLKAHRYADAERVYRADLAKWPGNGWSLFGLTRALEAQNKTQEAADTRAAFDRAWAQADHPLNTSCECIPDL